MSAPIPESASRSWRPITVAAVVLVAAGVGLWFWFKPPSDPEPSGPPDVVPLSESPFLNTRPDAQYVGSAACVKCHESQHKTFLHTGMSRSTAPVDVAKEPADATFDHTASGRRYRVERRGGQLWHREMPLDGKSDIVLSEFPLKYVVGSGRFGRTYLTEANGFMIESPVSFYTSKSAWGMSPGYDRHNLGFERAIGAGCLYCHLGRTESEPQSMHRHKVLEPAVGCERCHGPGSLHVALREKPATLEPGAIDYTIVNPHHLSRELRESVCQQCHLSPELLVPARGRKRTDFRPGLPLQDVAVGFSFVDSAHMTVTGHVEQMHQSKCYQKSSTMTCMTCHDPHGFPDPKQRVAFYRGKCQECHAGDACKVDPKVRHAQSPDNDCVHCHMPRGATDIQHVAFYHHRIGIHKKQEPAPSAPQGNARAGREALEPFHDLSRYGELDRKRLLGLAYSKAGLERGIESYNLRANQLLTLVWNNGLRDGAVAAGLARVRYWVAQRVGDPDPEVREFCETALQDPDLPGEDRCDLLFLLADGERRRGRLEEAAKYIRENIKLRRHSGDWTFLARCESALGRADESLKLLEHAATISPADARLRRQLVDLYEKQGNRERADYHRQRLLR
jgi:hypothetical protein